MKQFCNVIVQNGDRQAVKTLERVMNAEVSIRNPKTTELLNEYKDKKHEIDANVLAQPAFQFSPAGVKMQEVQNYLKLQKEGDRTREAIALLKTSTQNPDKFRALTDSFETFNGLLKELDSDQQFSDLAVSNQLGTFSKL